MENKEKIENIIKDFFLKAGSEAEIKKIYIEKEQEETESLIVNIKTKEANIFIGKQGTVLSDIQLLLRKIIKKKTEKDYFLNLDIDDYKKYKVDVKIESVGERENRKIIIEPLI